MSKTYEKVLALLVKGEVKVSDHGYDELASDLIYVRDIMLSAGNAVVVEDYPDYPKGPSVLVLQTDRAGKPIHVVWGIPRGEETPAVIVTAYRPDPKRWTDDFLKRRT